MSRIFLPLLAGLGLLALPAQAQPVLTEAEVVRGAVADHPSLEAARKRMEAARLAAVRYRGLPEPGLRFTVTELGIPVHNQPTVQVSYEQALPLGGQRKAWEEAGKLAAAELELDGVTAEAELEYAARVAFATWRGLHARRDLLEHHAKMGQDLLQALMRILAAGRAVPQARLARMAAEIEVFRADVASVDAALLAERARLNVLLGRMADAPLLPPERDLPTSALPGLRADGSLDPKVLQDHPSLERLRRSAAASRARSRAEQAATQATVTPGLGVMTMAQMPVALMFTVGVRWVDWPAFRERNQARVAEGLAEAQAADLTSAARMRSLQANLQQAAGRLRELEARRAGLRDKVLPLMHQAVQASVPALAAGTGSVAEVFEGSHRLAALDFQLADLETEWLLARASYLRLLRTDGSAAGGGMRAMTAPSTDSGDGADMAGH